MDANKDLEYCALDVGDAFLEEMARKSGESPGEVVMVIRRPGDTVLLVTKEFYPAGVYRLPSGQMKEGERPEEALKREASEETGLQVRVRRHLGAIRCSLRSRHRSTDYLSHVMLTSETAGQPAPRDIEERITGFREVDPCALRDIAGQLKQLPEPWSDWGRFRALAHEFAYRILCARSSIQTDRPEESC